GRPGASGSCSGGHGTEPPPRLEDVRAAAWWWMLEPTIPYDARRGPPARQWSPGSTGHHPPRRPSIGRHLEPPRRPPHMGAGTGAGTVAGRQYPEPSP